MKTDCYKELPSGYREDKVVDAKNVRFGVIMNVVALVVTVATYLLVDLVFAGRLTLGDLFRFDFSEGAGSRYVAEVLLPLVVLAVGMIVCIVLHELVHGAAYKILTKEKLTFGLTWSAAYCGLPNLFVGKKTALIAVLSPFVLFTTLFVVLVACVGNTPYGIAVKLIFAVHTGGCAGDLYDAALLLFRYRKGCLMNDDGLRQVFFVQDGQEARG